MACSYFEGVGHDPTPEDMKRLMEVEGEDWVAAAIINIRELAENEILPVANDSEADVLLRLLDRYENK